MLQATRAPRRPRLTAGAGANAATHFSTMRSARIAPMGPVPGSQRDLGLCCQQGHAHPHPNVRIALRTTVILGNRPQKMFCRKIICSPEPLNHL